ncbi:MAG TPA: DUF2281 domain-containing protein [Marinilabiliaceae bacterium]|mgnify:CR=1 FL=1|nr:DUF2281 domain-containing protein [Marinilabiliaceae bacterium]
MKVADLNSNIPINFERIVDLVKQLPDNEKMKLAEVLEYETNRLSEDDKTLTHYASEKVLARDWLIPEEDEAWKDL